MRLTSCVYCVNVTVLPYNSKISLYIPYLVDVSWYEPKNLNKQFVSGLGMRLRIRPPYVEVGISSRPCVLLKE